ncbi:31364_t:CDS:1, partial [Racocetra persica]
SQKKPKYIKYVISEYYRNRYSKSMEVELYKGNKFESYSPYSQVENKHVVYDQLSITEIIKVKDSEINNKTFEQKYKILEQKYKKCFLHYEEISVISCEHLEQCINLLLADTNENKKFSDIKHIYDSNMKKLIKIKELHDEIIKEFSSTIF